MNQVQNLAEPREVDPLLCFKGMLLKEGNNPFGEVIQPPDPVGHAITVISSYHTAAEEFLQSVEDLNVTLMLHDREFGEYLKLTRHFWVGIDADVETTFAVNKTDDPLGL